MDEFQWGFDHSESFIEWDEENLLKLGMDFLRLVLVNMKEENAHIRFDWQHNNYRPNYQIQFENGLHRLFDGISHEALRTLDKPNLAHFSDTFEFSKIRAAYEHLYAEFKH